jgi:hypothetical protein
MNKNRFLMNKIWIYEQMSIKCDDVINLQKGKAEAQPTND